MSDVLLSICIPTFNRAQIVYECVKDCLSYQTEQIEVVVNDNCSTDDTCKLLSEIKDERFHYYCNDTNIGYSNLVVALTKGHGKYCLLLSDEDAIVNVDWEKVFSQLRYENETAVFQSKYCDENGKVLVEGPERRFKKNQYDTYWYTRLKFGFAGALIVKREIAEKVWNEINKDSFMWRLYPHVILPIYCVREGDCQLLKNFEVHRTERNNTGLLDTKAWIGGVESEPYWSLISRKKQSFEWIAIFSALNIDEDCKCKLLYSSGVEHLRQLIGYWDILNDSQLLNTPLFLKRQDIVERDKKIRKREWIKLFFEHGRDMEACVKKELSKVKIALGIRIRYRLQLVWQFMRLIRHLTRKGK